MPYKDFNAIVKRIIQSEEEGEAFCEGLDCKKCPAGRRGDSCDTSIVGLDINKFISLLDAWDVAHPAPKPKTYADDFFEKFPNGKRTVEGYPVNNCVRGAYGQSASKCGGMSCATCWNRPMPEKGEAK